MKTVHSKPKQIEVDSTVELNAVRSAITYLEGSTREVIYKGKTYIVIQNLINAFHETPSKKTKIRLLLAIAKELPFPQIPVVILDQNVE